MSEPTGAGTMTMAASEAQRVKSWPEAGEAPLRAFAAPPLDARGFEERGDLMAELGRADEALADYSRACALAESPSAYLKRGS
ncbi:MAG: hypothetical protein K2W96_22220, partial [Gemmataceae bacterium]|nr:hypothetical protein [Gemmataceae bacterium]